MVSGVLNISIDTYNWQSGSISGLTYGIETTSSFIGTFAPPVVSIPWTTGYEILGRQGIARLPWYKNTFKPWARRKLGFD